MNAPSMTSSLTSSALENVGKTKCKWEDCLLEFDTSKQCLSHVRQDHLESGAVLCKWKGCFKISSSRCNLSNHIPKHLKIVAGYCYYCDKGFKWRGDYKKHLEMHSNDQKLFNDVATFLLE